MVSQLSKHALLTPELAAHMQTLINPTWQNQLIGVNDQVCIWGILASTAMAAAYLALACDSALGLGKKGNWWLHVHRVVSS
jgi:hypothetical protein